MANKVELTLEQKLEVCEQAEHRFIEARKKFPEAFEVITSIITDHFSDVGYKPLVRMGFRGQGAA